MEILILILVIGMYVFTLSYLNETLSIIKSPATYSFTILLTISSLFLIISVLIFLKYLEKTVINIISESRGRDKEPSWNIQHDLRDIKKTVRAYTDYLESIISLLSQQASDHGERGISLGNEESESDEIKIESNKDDLKKLLHHWWINNKEVIEEAISRPYKKDMIQEIKRMDDVDDVRYEEEVDVILIKPRSSNYLLSIPVKNKMFWIQGKDLIKYFRGIPKIIGKFRIKEIKYPAVLSQDKELIQQGEVIIQKAQE